MARHRKKGRQFCRPLRHHSLLIMLTLLNQGLNGVWFFRLAVTTCVKTSEGAGGMAGMATAIPILVDLCSKAPPGTNFVFGDCPTNILSPAPPLSVGEKILTVQC